MNPGPGKAVRAVWGVARTALSSDARVRPQDPATRLLLRAVKPREELAALATPGGRIVVGIDDSPGGLAALRLAVAQARSGNAQLVAVRSWALGLPRHGGLRRRRLGPVHPHTLLHWDRTRLSEASRAFVKECFADAVGGMPRDVALTVKTPEGEPGAALAGIAAEGDMIVVGQEPPLTVRRVLHGSVSSYCRKHARCPVVVVPAGEPRADAKAS